MKKGFTLIEILVAVGLFTIIMTISMGSILGIFEANRKARALKSVMTNLNVAMESISKEMRFGQNYHCGSGTLTTPQNCASGASFISFLSSEGVQTNYQFNGASIEKLGSVGTYIPLTAPEVAVDDLTFYVLGAGVNDGLQPKVIIKIKSHAGMGNSRTDFTLETLISQRRLDI